MTSKEKFDYWWKIVFLSIFGLAVGAAAVYTILTYPLSIFTILYFAIGGGGCGFSFLAAKKLFNEYKRSKTEEKE